ncbi:hypothetical protein ABZ565_31830 [Streptomyces sp. NPDC016469]|uniref:hypothetical protein n=1 Tax=Streptomyces sp. NPDC016469 TaxID=3157191 RepID=UPI0033C6669E
MVLAVAEQILVDEHPDDDPARLTDLAAGVVSSQSGLLKIRLECCLADLAVRAGRSPEEAYAGLDRHALGGRIPERPAVLVHMRRGRALALADLGSEAIEAYRRAVLAATREDLGGDARHALRSISFLSDQYNAGFKESSQAMLSARTVGAKGARLINLSFNPAVSALEALVDGRLPDASRAAHQWLWQDRLSGALTDENLAHQRYGEVFNRAGEAKYSVRQFILAGRRKDACSAAESLTEFLDVSSLLDIRARWVCSAAAAVIGQQADLIPDDAVAGIAARLADIVITGTQSALAGIRPVIQALGALGALDERLPEAPAQQILPLLIEWIPREPGISRSIDEQMLAFLAACTKADLPVADQAAQALLDAWKLDVNGAEGLLADLHTRLPSAVPVVRKRAQQGHRGAAAVLAHWQVDDPSIAETARELADAVLAEPVGTDRPFYSMGTIAPQCAAFLKAAQTPRAPQAPACVNEWQRTCCCGPKIVGTWPTDDPRPFAHCPSSPRLFQCPCETTPSNDSWSCTRIRGKTRLTHPTPPEPLQGQHGRGMASARSDPARIRPSWHHCRTRHPRRTASTPPPDLPRTAGRQRLAAGTDRV